MRQITSSQLTEWQAYDTLEPVGDLEATFMAATVCSVIINAIQAVVGGKGKQRVFTQSDFIPKWGIEPESEEESLQPKIETIEEMKKLFKQLAADSVRRSKGPSRGQGAKKESRTKKRKVVRP